MRTIPVFLLILFSFTLTSNSGARQVHFATIQQNSPEQQDPYRSRFFNVNGIPDLSVFTPSGDIEVIHNPDINGVLVELYVKRGFSIWSGSKSLDNYRIILSQSRNSITASVEKKQASSGYFGSDEIQFKFVVQTPKKITSNLRSMSGHILLDGVEGRQFLQSDAGNVNLINSKGELSLVSSAGSVFMKNNQGLIQVKSIAGDVKMEESTGETRIRTISGNIQASEYSGSFICATTSGNVDLSVMQITEGVFLETISGNVTMELMNLQGLDIHSESMKMDVDQLPASYISDRRSNGRTTNLKLGDGEIPVNISTISGTVLIKQKAN